MLGVNGEGLCVYIRLLTAQTHSRGHHSHPPLTDVLSHLVFLYLVFFLFCLFVPVHIRQVRYTVLSLRYTWDTGCFVPCCLLVPRLIVCLPFILLSIVFFGKESNKKTMNKCLWLVVI